ncbi:hypothetical protein HDV06_003402 [Boothiomyces sp. JEL0866]|nr:hypothetical protein HDV06_003354 [Boothiomyces sp. JEL0866]KAJ3325632.1 hypothetical protein HDV06_003402 [Boothiomyces sp. JEL0866]
MTKEITQLVTLVKYHPDLVIEEIKRNPDLAHQECPINQRTLLHVAAGHGILPLVDLLISMRADVNKVDKYGETPVFRSIRFRMDDVTLKLISRAANLNAKDIKLQTPLHRACAMGTANIVKKLLDFGCDPIALDADGKTPYDLGTESKFAVNEVDMWREEMLKAIESVSLKETLTGSSTMGEENEISQGDAALQNDISELARYIADEPSKASEYISKYPLIIPVLRNSSNRTPLHIAAGYGRIEIVKQLLNLGLEMNYLDNFGQTPIFRAIEFKHLDIVQLFIRKGARLDIQDTKKRTCLHYACRSDSTAIVEILLQNNCDPALPEQDGLLPLDFAIKYGVDPSDWEELIKNAAIQRSNKRQKLSQSKEKKPVFLTQVADSLEIEPFTDESFDSCGCTTEDGHWALSEFTQQVDDWLYENNLVHKIGDMEMMRQSMCWIVYIKPMDIFLLYPSTLKIKTTGNI